VKIHIGDRLGSKYDYLRYYVPFNAKTLIKLRYIEYETLRERMYETHSQFIPKKGDVVYDVGANYGNYSLIWTKLYGAKVIAFEPLEENYFKAQRNFAINSGANIILYNLAVGNKNGTIKTNIDGNMMSVQGSVHSSMKMIKLDDYILSEDEQPVIDIMKIDIEGYEFEALMGMSRILSDVKPKIIIETHSSDLMVGCFSYLQDFGYEMEYIQNQRFGNGKFDLVAESFWMNEDGIK